MVKILNFESMRNTYNLGFVSIPIPIILYLAFTFHATLAANYVPTEKILLSCGGACSLLNAGDHSNIILGVSKSNHKE